MSTILFYLRYTRSGTKQYSNKSRRKKYKPKGEPRQEKETRPCPSSQATKQSQTVLCNKAVSSERSIEQSIYMAATTAMAKTSIPLETLFTTPAFMFGTVLAELLAAVAEAEPPVAVPLDLVEVALVEATLFEDIPPDVVVALVVVVMAVPVVLEAPGVVEAPEVVEAPDVVVALVDEGVELMAVVEATFPTPAIWKRGRKLYWLVDSETISTV
jgi:hypothetical protein